MTRLTAALARLAPYGLLVALLGLFVAGHLLQVTVSPVLTASMVPAFGPGDALVTRQEPVAALRPGQVAVLVPPGETTGYAHRIVSVDGDPSRPAVRTKGDANAAADGWELRPVGTVPVVVGAVPAAGRLLLLPTEPRGRALLVALLGLGLTFFAVRLILAPGDRIAPALD